MGDPDGETSRYLVEKFALSDPDARSILQESKDIEERALALCPRPDFIKMTDRSPLDRVAAYVRRTA